MKKLLFAAFMIIGLTINAQEDTSTPTEKGKILIEVNTGARTIGNTGGYIRSNDYGTFWSLGFEGGYFTIDNLAVKLGLGYYYGSESVDALEYKIGAEYYIKGIVPIGIDFTGVSYFSENYPNSNSNWLGLQGGYAYFLGENVSIKPALRYNIGLEDGQKGLFQGLIGFALYF